MVAELENNIITALILVVGVILFFMGARNCLFVALAIPLSMLMSMLFISAFGMTLNMIVLFSLMLGLGMLVDNAIVLVENIYRHAEMGKSLFDASIDGTKEIALAVIASTADHRRRLRAAALLGRDHGRVHGLPAQDGRHRPALLAGRRARRSAGGHQPVHEESKKVPEGEQKELDPA